jgi:hypothetical protein
MHATPASLVETEPPGRRPRLRQVSGTDCYQASLDFYRSLSGSRREIFLLTAPASVLALYSCFAAVALRACLVCMLPLSFMAGQSLLTAIPPAPGSQRSMLPGAWSDFPGRYPVSADKPLSFRFLASRGPLCR